MMVKMKLLIRDELLSGETTAADFGRIEWSNYFCPLYARQNDWTLNFKKQGSVSSFFVTVRKFGPHLLLSFIFDRLI